VRISFLEREREKKRREREREEVKSIAQAGNMEKILEKKKRIILYTYQVLLLRK
jgi:hypothetical protein